MPNMYQPSTSGQRSRRRNNSSQRPFSTPSLSPTPSSRSDSQSFKELAANAIASLATTSADEYTAFATHIAAELRNLPTSEQAKLAKRKLARALVDIVEEVLLMVSAYQIHLSSQFHHFSQNSFLCICFDLAPSNFAITAKHNFHNRRRRIRHHQSGDRSDTKIT